MMNSSEKYLEKGKDNDEVQTHQTKQKASGIFNRQTNWKISVLVLCVCCFIENMIISGSATVVLSTLEKEFFLTSTQSGFFLGIYELAGFLSAPIFGYFGTSKTFNKMRIISLSLLLISLGSFLIGLSVFIKKPYLDFINYSLTDGSNRVHQLSLKNEPNNSICVFDNSYAKSTTPDNSFFSNVFRDETTEKCPSDSTYDYSSRLEVLLYIGHLIIGFGSVAAYSVGVAYIEEITLPHQSSYCQAAFYGSGSIGGGVGFLISGQFLNINARFYMSSYEPNDWITKEHVYWIGAWWLPYVTYGTLCTILFVLVFLFSYRSTFPRGETNTDEKQKPIETTQPQVIPTVETRSKFRKLMQTFKTKASQFFKKFKRIIKNYQFLFAIFSAVTEGSIVKGFLGFVPKYVEYQFDMAASDATLILGVIALVSVIIGSLLSAYLINRFKLDAKKCSVYVLVIFSITPFFFLILLNYCPEKSFIDTSMNASSVNRACADCDCLNQFNPVCFDRELARFKNLTSNAYQSPCHAACHTKITDDTFKDCRCLDESLLLPELADVVLSSEKCNERLKCFDKLIINGAAAFIIVFFTAMSVIPHLKASLGTIGDNTILSFGLGVRGALINLFGNFLGSLIIGNIVDSSCSYWQRNCFDHKVCKVYDNRLMSVSLALVGFCFRGLSAISMAVVTFIYFRREKQQRLANKNADNASAANDDTQVTDATTRF